MAFSDLPLIDKLRVSIRDTLLDSYVNTTGVQTEQLKLKGELNYYYDTSKCGIGFHGDAERRIVVGVRFGATMPLHFQWFIDSKPIHERTIINLNHGDIYMMSNKAVGNDWRKRKIPTLRHAAGCEKYTTIKEKSSKSTTEEYVINPITKRRIKIGGSLYNKLVKDGITPVGNEVVNPTTERRVKIGTKTYMELKDLGYELVNGELVFV